MGIFDYVCYIDKKDCPLKKSNGQEFTYGDIFAVDKNFTKKISCDYLGYGYAELSEKEDYKKIYDLGFIEYYGSTVSIDDNKLFSYLACPKCAKSIKKEYKVWTDFVKN